MQMSNGDESPENKHVIARPKAVAIPSDFRMLHGIATSHGFLAMTW